MLGCLWLFTVLGIHRKSFSYQVPRNHQSQSLSDWLKWILTQQKNVLSAVNLQIAVSASTWRFRIDLQHYEDLMKWQENSLSSKHRIKVSPKELGCVMITQLLESSQKNPGIDLKPTCAMSVPHWNVKAIQNVSTSGKKPLFLPININDRRIVFTASTRFIHLSSVAF